MPLIVSVDAFNLNGKVLWGSSMQTSNFVALSTNGKLLYAINWSRVYALNITNGKIVWQHSVGITGYQKSLFDHGTLYLTLEGPYQRTPSGKPSTSSIIALNGNTGSLVWEDKNMDKPTIQAVTNGALYVELEDAQGNGHVYALRTSNHTLLWNYTQPGPKSTHAEGSGNTLIVIP